VAHRCADLSELAATAAVDGGLGESLAAATAAARLAVATDPATREHLEEVVIDEARHAALAWEIVDHAIALGGDEVVEAVMAALGDAMQQLREAPPKLEPLAPRFGLCGTSALLRAREAVLTMIFEGHRAA
jgi:hypothetical protein